MWSAATSDKAVRLPNFQFPRFFNIVATKLLVLSKHQPRYCDGFFHGIKSCEQCGPICEPWDEVVLGLREIYKSNSGSTTKIKETKDAADDWKLRTTRFLQSICRLPLRWRRCWRKLLRNTETSAEILLITADLFFAGDTRHRLFILFKKVVKTTLKEEKITELVDKMDSLRAEMTLNIVGLIRCYALWLLEISLIYLFAARDSLTQPYDYKILSIAWRSWKWMHLDTCPTQ